MGEYKNSDNSKVISLKDHMRRKKHKRFYAFINRICGFFHKDIKNNPAKKESYKKTVNH